MSHLTQKKWKVFVVGDVLQFRGDDASALLEQGLISPVRVERLKARGDSVVLAHKERVQRGHAEVLVDPCVSREEAAVLRVQSTSFGGRWRR